MNDGRQHGSLIAGTAIFGGASSGKTTLLHRLLAGQFVKDERNCVIYFGTPEGARSFRQLLPARRVCDAERDAGGAAERGHALILGYDDRSRTGRALGAESLLGTLVEARCLARECRGALTVAADGLICFLPPDALGRREFLRQLIAGFDLGSAKAQALAFTCPSLGALRGVFGDYGPRLFKAFANLFFLRDESGVHDRTIHELSGNTCNLSTARLRAGDSILIGRAKGGWASVNRAEWQSDLNVSLS